ncbi:DUF5130 family protein [Actinoalloteichus hymeniacidonis]|uniref:DUF477 family protein n=1 Tax=Actinoalloteichus hymeniacidonis TaxID=340345 RepID=A0AAC9MXM2_9PSEU|nr:DUF5130 family protein [Actinoalloteichus hymeniacidonis]AOS62400.1 putative DUF477 family protein [Actinoalloteichus hymeniacidonis]MBB5909569.1 hypothetical protein [Actinoalloteichus hymeniacidonis]
MGTGELTRRVEVDNAEHGLGAVVTHTGRVSVARRLVTQEPALPFTPSQLARLDEALTLAGRSTGLDFSIYLGALGEDSRARAEELHASMGASARDALLIAVSPAGRVVEVVTGGEAARRVPNRSCKLAVMSMVASFKEGDLVGGLLSGLRMLSDQAGNEP